LTTDNPRTDLQYKREVFKASSLDMPVLCPGDGPHFSWIDPDGTRVASSGEAAVIETNGAARFTDASLQAARLYSRVSAQGEGELLPLLVGGFAFSDQQQVGGCWRGFPALRLLLPREQWICRDGWITRFSLKGEAAAASPFTGLPLTGAPAGQVADAVMADARAEDFRHWASRVELAQAAMREGELDKVVLSRWSHGERQRPDLKALLTRLARQRPACFTFALEHTGALLLGSSPELLASLTREKPSRRRLRSVALAGSAPRATDPGEDRAAATALMSCAKNRREQALVVEALVAGFEELVLSPEYDDRPSLLALPEAWHLGTAISSPADELDSLLSAVDTLHPSPAVCGTPREPARAIIEASEERGWYTGGVGWMDSRGDGQFAVVLRAALYRDGALLRHAGAGILPGSTAELEWQECEAKLRAMSPVDGRDATDRKPRDEQHAA